MQQVYRPWCYLRYDIYIELRVIHSLKNIIESIKALSFNFIIIVLVFFIFIPFLIKSKVKLFLHFT